ncbi:hypothetical protein [Enterococcus sp. DIV0876]|uniref:hypothetical protein n=1 Tax=Enterococcus sp. DIV0876 TaxID=2774633 RepID=UPI003D2FEE0D
MQKNKVEYVQKRKWLLLLLLLLLAGGIHFWFNQRESSQMVSADLLPAAGDASDRQLAVQSQEIADANYFTLQINPDVVFEDGTSKGSIEIVNPGINVYPIAVDISLLESEEIIYSSGAIFPNQYIEQAKLAIPLAQGEHKAKATINIYDPDTKEKQGVTEAELTILVKN